MYPQFCDLLGSLGAWDAGIMLWSNSYVSLCGELAGSHQNSYEVPPVSVWTLSTRTTGPPSMSATARSTSTTPPLARPPSDTPSCSQMPPEVLLRSSFKLDNTTPSGGLPNARFRWRWSLRTRRSASLSCSSLMPFTIHLLSLHDRILHQTAPPRSQSSCDPPNRSVRPPGICKPQSSARSLSFSCSRCWSAVEMHRLGLAGRKCSSASRAHRYERPGPRPPAPLAATRNALAFVPRPLPLAARRGGGAFALAGGLPLGFPLPFFFSSSIVLREGGGRVHP